MTPVVPKKTTLTQPSRLFQELRDLLYSGLECVAATAGWIGLQDSGGLNFPVRIGTFSDSWPTGQPGYGSIWGYTINDEPAVLNNLKIGSKRGDPPLRNLLTCPLMENRGILGHITLANKEHDFTTYDAVVLRGLAHHMVRLLGRSRMTTRPPADLSAAWKRILDRAAEGIVLLEESGVLIYANATWLDWTGFRADELLGQTAPFPFWVSQGELVQTLNMAPVATAGALPFRRRDQSLLWCAVETDEEQWDDHRLTVVFLRRTSAPSQVAAASKRDSHGIVEEKTLSFRSPSPDWLPLLLDLDNGIEGWEARWEEQTGLSVTDVKDSRCELVLDWLFPQQHDRNRVADCFHRSRPRGCQLVLEVALLNGSRKMLCTFSPLPADPATAAPRRWLLLVGELERTSQPDILDGTSHPAPSPHWRGCNPADGAAAVDKTESQPQQ